MTFTTNMSPALATPASPLPPPRARARTASSHCSATAAATSTPSALFCSSSYIWNRIRKQSYWWHAAFWLVLTGWALILFINTSCRFVEILPSSSLEDENKNDNDLAPPIARGIHRGQLLPTSSCQAWGLLYNSPEEDEFLQMDTSMVTTRVVAVLSVFTSLAVLSGLAYSGLVRPLSFVARWVLVFGSIVTAGLQARSRLYVHDGFCENVHIVVANTDEEQADVVYDTCSSDTLAFHLTSTTIIIFLLAALLMACDSPYRRVRHAEDTLMMTTTIMPVMSPPLEPAVTNTGPASQQPRQRSLTTESFTSRRSCPGTPSSTAIFPDKDPV